jgi:mannosyltransferase OCH1-like enzyme
MSKIVSKINMRLQRNTPFSNVQEIQRQMQKRFYQKPYILKSNYNSVIPLKIYQTWWTKNLPPAMRERVELLKQQNPRFEHFLFDDSDCRNFIKEHFNPDVLYAYDNLVPGAYKADLWRYCVLYINGGIYMDIKLICVNGFKLIELTEQEHFVKDRLGPLTIYNALMVCKPGNPFLLDAIHRVVKNVKSRYYGFDSLAPTGPRMLGSIIMEKKLNLNIDMNHFMDGGFVIYKNRFVISTEYPEYNAERLHANNTIKTKRYDALWSERRIYSRI